MKLSTLVLAFIAYKVLFEKKAPRGDVEIGDALVGSSPSQWKPWPGDAPDPQLRSVPR